MRPTNELAQTIPSQNPTVDAMASAGRKGDTMMAHVTPGDYVIPKDILVQHPEFLVKLKKAMEDEGEDYRNHMVGSGFENINPETGAPEFGFGKSFKKSLGGVIRALPGGSSKLGSTLYGAGLGVGLGLLTGGLGAGAGLSAGALGAGTAGAGVFGGALGANAQGTQARMASNVKQNAEKAGLYDQGYASGTNVSDMALPQSLQELGGLTDIQKRSYLASQGAQGGGLGGSSRDYYINLLQRNIQSNPNQQLLPVESQYLSQGGLNTSLTGQSLINALRGF